MRGMRQKGFAVLTEIMLLFALSACGGGGGGGGSATGNEPSAPVSGYLLSGVSSPSGGSTGTGFVVAASWLTNNSVGASSYSNPQDVALSLTTCEGDSGIVVNNTTKPGSWFVYVPVVGTGSTSYMYEYAFDPKTGTFSDIGVSSWSNPGGNCPSGKIVWSTSNNCVFLSPTVAFPINPDGTLGSGVNPGEANPGYIVQWLGTDATGNYLLASAQTVSGACNPSICFVYSYSIHSGCTLSNTPVSQLGLTNLPDPGALLPDENTYLAPIPGNNEIEQYVVSSSGGVSQGSALPFLTNDTVYPIMVSPDGNEVYVSEYGHGQSTLNVYGVTPAGGGGASLSLLQTLTQSVSGGTGLVTENVSPGSSKNGTLFFSVGFPVYSVGSNGTLSSTSYGFGDSGVWVPAG
ncbi:MAG: lactonase family protein [Leptospirales bacterium]